MDETRREAPVTCGAQLGELILGWVLAEGVRVAPADAQLTTALDVAIAARAREGIDEGIKAAVRDLLRGHGYKPTGRGKPASEFLARAAADGAFPRISNVVDINNLVSLESGLPISIFDLDRARGSAAGLEVRRGHPSESFVFNTSGQAIEIAGLPGVARVGGEAIGNPVKDSMLAKVGEDTERVLAVIYGSARVVTLAAMERLAARFAVLLQTHAAAARIESGAVAAI